jgi:murein DD-endopeptidase MepM/ murein hydrolase activator NlpD
VLCRKFLKGGSSDRPFFTSLEIENPMFIFPKMREPDDFGAGHFGASRGNRTHRGVDIAAEAGSACYSVTDGIVTKFGYPYADDLSYRYVEVTYDGVTRFRYFYVDPHEDLEIGDTVTKGFIWVLSRMLLRSTRQKMKKMNNHIHFEVIEKGEYVDPVDALWWSGGPNLHKLGLVPV